MAKKIKRQNTKKKSVKTSPTLSNHPSTSPDAATVNNNNNNNNNPVSHSDMSPENHNLNVKNKTGADAYHADLIHNSAKDAKAKKINESFDVRTLFKTEKIVNKHTAKSRHFLRDALLKAGYTSDEKDFRKRIWRIDIFAVTFLSLIVMLYGIFAYAFSYAMIVIIALWIVGLPFFWLLSWAITYFVLDYMKYKRRKEIEEVWPEYLQLVVSNINAGMLIDVALWNAVKPKYKILSKEIEDVAKQTLTGIELSVALKDFSEKYDSPMLKRTISILIEGMESGGRVATLLNKIALDIEDHRIMRKEMAASVMTYAIFISFATIVAAPFLFGLATTLLTVIQKIMGQVAQTSSASTGSFISISGGSVKVSDFKIFSIVMLTITSLMSSMIISNIRKGGVRDGLKYIPLFIIATLILYFIASQLLGTLMASLI